MSFRRWLGAAVVSLCVGSMASTAAAKSVDRVSEYEPTATEAWAESGFRIQLRFGFEGLGMVDRYFDPKPLPSFAVEPGIRLGRWASISGTLRYTVDEVGLRWTNTADLTLHLFHGLFVAGGFGYGGLFVGPCGGGSPVTVGRMGWLIPLGQVFSMGPVAQFDWQAPIYCESDPLAPAFQAANFSWSFGWR